MHAEIFETVKDAVGDIQCAMALVERGSAYAQGINDGYARASAADGWTLIERAYSLMDGVVTILGAVAEQA